MTISLLSALVLPFALQSAVPDNGPEKPASLDDLSIEEATGPRCGIAFAIMQGWQEAGDARGQSAPDLKQANAREFFLTAMVRLIDRYSLERSDVVRIVENEKTRHRADDFADVGVMMPACLALLEASKAQGG
ncbi:hypothetical protein INR77_03340 [Erythrobacter sp. SCSIO 43205]|uniref:hypothetical protein n=1 Tax=Erythrobacter sp. SCSIO 43205 TaxID=2779361 RepID=UPI001CA94DAD|nr:hypothetical protein [Erythrobacter sp. SCSIO 43205]UAB78772.1 hypothetical protein INR77_03340 [Erythrobacter sp. SCSIO 43205]